MNRPHSIRLTPDGLGLVLAGLIVLFAALSTGANLVYVVGSFLVALFLVSVALAARTPAGLTGHVRLPEEAAEGVPFPYEVVLENGGRRDLAMLAVSPWLVRAAGGPSTRAPGAAPAPARDPEGPRAPRPGGLEAMRLLELRRGQREALSGVASLPMRGAYRLAGIRVESVYPAGLLVSETRLPAGGEIVCLPSPLRHPFPVIPGFHQRAAWSDTGSNVKGEGTSFYGLRDYAPGDPIRKIHWKASARHGHPLVSEEEEDRINRYYIFIDLRESRLIGEGRDANLEVSIRIGASLALQLLKQNCPVRIYLLDSELSRSPQSFGSRDIPRVMRFLGRLSYSPEGDFALAVTRALADVPPGSFVLFVLPDTDPRTIDLVRGLARGPYPVYCLFNLAGREAARAAGRDPAVRSLIGAGATTILFDGIEERVVAA